MLLEKPNNLNYFVLLKMQASEIFKGIKSSLLRDFIYFLFFFLFCSCFLRLMLISWSGADVCLFVLIINLGLSVV